MQRLLGRMGAGRHGRGRMRLGRDGALAVAAWMVLGGGAFVFFSTTAAASVALAAAQGLQLEGTGVCCKGWWFYACVPG